MNALNGAVYVITIAALGATAPGRPPSRFTSAQLRDKMRDTQFLIKKVDVTYRTGLNRAGVDLGEEYYAYRTLRARQNGDFFIAATHGYSTLPWDEDPFQQQGLLLGEHFVNFNPVNRTILSLHIPPDATLPGTAPNDFFMVSTGIWPFGKRPAPLHFGPGRPFVLKDIADCESYSLVEPFQERIEDRWCHVLVRPGLDRLWLDAARGCTLMAREYRDAKGTVMQRFELLGLREVERGLWMPRWIRNVHFNYDDPILGNRSAVTKDVIITIINLSVNDRTVDIEKYRPPPGALGLSADSPPRQLIAGGVAHLDNLAEWLKRYGFAEQSALTTQSKIALGLYSVVVLVGLYEVRRWYLSSV